jgi:hypothetical protein
VKKSLLMLPIALLAAALALSACGGGGSSSSSGGGDESSIETAIEEDATTSSPSKCTKYVTVAFNEQQSGLSGAKATKQCEEEAGEEPAESVDVSEIEVEGESATAEAAVTGSSLDSQTLELEMVKEGGDWKINQALAFAKFDAKALGENLEVGLEKSGEVEPAEIKCLGEGVAELSQSEAEELAFEASLAPLEKLGCE